MRHLMKRNRKFIGSWCFLIRNIVSLDRGFAYLYKLYERNIKNVLRKNPNITDNNIHIEVFLNGGKGLFNLVLNFEDHSFLAAIDDVRYLIGGPSSPQLSHMFLTNKLYLHYKIFH